MEPMSRARLVVGYAQSRAARARRGDSSFWIQRATQNRGGLHRSLGIPEGQTIPLDRIRWAARQPGKLGKQGRLALTLRSLSPHVSGTDSETDELSDSRPIYDFDDVYEEESWGGGAMGARIGKRPLMPGVPRIWGPKEILRGGKASFWTNAGIYPPGVIKRQVALGTRHEMEHTRDPRLAREIALDHLMEDRHYYTKLARAGL